MLKIVIIIGLRLLYPNVARECVFGNLCLLYPNVARGCAFGNLRLFCPNEGGRRGSISAIYAFFSLFLVSFSVRASSFAMRSAPNHLKVIGQRTPAKMTMRK